MQELLSMADDESRALWDTLSLAYTDSQGHPKLLEEIAELYKFVSKESIVEIVPEEGIFIAMNTLLEPGDHIITTFPGYQSLFEIAASIGCTISKWMPNLEHDNAFSVQELKGLVHENTKLLVINFPHNPTGALITQTEFNEIVSFAAEKGIRIFSDEMYRFTELDPADRLSSICEMNQKSISLFGLSKSFSLPGLRVGWLASQDQQLIENIKKFKDYTTICGSAPSEILAIIALRSRERILTRTHTIIFNNLTILEDFFRQYTSVFSWVKPKGGTICFPKLLLDMTIDDFCDSLLKKKGVMLLPSSVLGYPSNHFRVGFGRKNMPDVLEKLEDFIIKMGYT